jgi:hypothetical protein
MAIVQAGKQFTAEDMKRTAGDVAAMIRDHIQSAGDFKLQLESFPDPDLIELGLNQEEINVIKGFYIGDIPTFQNALLNSQWIKRLIGLGV